MVDFSELFLAVLVLFMVVCAWADFFVAILKIIWMLRVPLIITVILYFAYMVVD